MRRLVATAVRHVGAYADLLAVVASETQAAFKRRLGLLVAALTLGVGGIVSIWATVVLYAWNLPSRNVVALLVATALILAALLCCWLAVRTGKRGPGKTRLAHELRLDRELLESWSQSS
jgi:uncharacterized membrane protein YqjE